MNEPLLLIPGLNCTEALYQPQIDVFSTERPVIVADHRQDDRIEAIAERVLAAAPERFALAGLSMGGYIALAMLRQAPERVTRLALLDTTARPDTEEGIARRHQLMAMARGGQWAEVHTTLWPRLVHPQRYDDKPLEAVVKQMMDDTGIDAFCRQQEAILNRVDSRPFLPSVTCPTLVLVGADDVITPVEVAEEMAAAIPHSVLEIVPQTGHLATLEAPISVNAALAKWLRRPALS